MDFRYSYEIKWTCIYEFEIKWAFHLFSMARDCLHYGSPHQDGFFIVQSPSPGFLHNKFLHLEIMNNTKKNSRWVFVCSASTTGCLHYESRHLLNPKKNYEEAQDFLTLGSSSWHNVNQISSLKHTTLMVWQHRCFKWYLYIAGMKKFRLQKPTLSTRGGTKQGISKQLKKSRPNFTSKKWNETLLLNQGIAGCDSIFQ